MAGNEPATKLDRRFSEEDAAATPWEEARRQLEAAEIFWISTVRPDGRPHVTPLPAVWLDGALHFCTGPTERKARNLAGNPNVVLTTGCSTYSQGLDLVVEGEAVRVRDDEVLRRLARTWTEKYGGDWRFEVRDGAFWHAPGEAHVFRVAPTKAFGFSKGHPFGQTRWTWP
jgi:nitroimidazol reductase NimA-like FMN-containing flavoprotein (pyridoxamine 5'-phosphate oxidase superfamily)